MSATPTTEATEAEVLLAYGNGWHGVNCDGNFFMDKPCSCGLADQLDKVQAQARSESAAQVALLREALERCRNDLLAYGNHLADRRDKKCSCGQHEAIKAASRVLTDTDAAAKEYEAAIAAKAVRAVVDSGFRGAEPDDYSHLLVVVAAFLANTQPDSGGE